MTVIQTSGPQVRLQHRVLEAVRNDDVNTVRDSMGEHGTQAIVSMETVSTECSYDNPGDALEKHDIAFCISLKNMYAPQRKGNKLILL